MMPSPEEFRTRLEGARDQHGTSLAELSRRAPTLVIFLRHYG